jgi:hypothetical protein
VGGIIPSTLFLYSAATVQPSIPDHRLPDTTLGFLLFEKLAATAR